MNSNYYAVKIGENTYSFNVIHQGEAVAIFICNIQGDQTVAFLDNNLTGKPYNKDYLYSFLRRTYASSLRSNDTVEKLMKVGIVPALLRNVARSVIQIPIISRPITFYTQ